MPDIFAPTSRSSSAQSGAGHYDIGVLSRSESQADISQQMLAPDETYAKSLSALRSRTGALEASLRKLSGSHRKSEPGVLVGCEDFFDGGSLAPNTCLDMRAAYEFIKGDLVDLSKRHPTVIIAPGSMYISSAIPKAHRLFKFYQDGQNNRSLAGTTCYTSSIMPVLFGGDLLGVCRKGECIELQETKGKGTTYKGLSNLDELKGSGKLRVTSYHEDDLTSMTDGEGSSSTCYLGRTLLPGEQTVIEQQLGKSPKDIFKNEFLVNGNSVLAVMCSEFRTELGTSAAQKVSSSSTGKLLQSKSYDLVLHSTSGGAVPKELLGNALYIHADRSNDTEVSISDSATPPKSISRMNPSSRLLYFQVPHTGKNVDLAASATAGGTTSKDS